MRIYIILLFYIRHYHIKP